MNKNESPENTQKARRRPAGLQVQFQIALGTIFLLFCVLVAWLIYVHEKENIEQAALKNSRIVLASVESMQDYVRNVLRPKMFEVAGPNAFILEAMSVSYVSRAVMDRFHKSMPDYRYRRVAVNARNPLFEPKATELKLIHFFQKNPRALHWQGIRKINGVISFIDAQPVRMKASCLKCHGRPEDAPAPLIKIYGRKRGFGYHENQIAGITAVSIPVAEAMGKIRSRALSVFWVMFGLMFILYLVISFVFNRMVVHSLQDLLGIFRYGLVDETEVALLNEASSKNEIHELSDAARKLTAHLQKARQEMVRHTEILEDRVNERTRELEKSRIDLRKKVAQRNCELQTLNRIAELTTQSFSLSDILPGVLEQTLGLIPARGAAIYLFSGNENGPSLVLEYQRNADKLSLSIDPSDRPPAGKRPASLKEAIWIAAGGEMSRFVCMRNQNCLNVPLICRERVLGVMTFVGVAGGDTSSELQALLMSVGKQVGSTIDSLNNFSALLKNKELLQAVFDGIPDMMVLLSPELDIRMANRAYLKKHGISLEEALSLKCRALEGRCDCPFAGKRMLESLSSRQPIREEVTTQSGEIYMVYYYPILDDNGRLWGILRYARDITLEKQVEQRIQQTEKMAAIGQLAAGVAHEINNPMGIILCYADLIKRQAASDVQIVSDIEIIEKQARNCQRIVSDLLNFARSRETKPKPADVNTTVKQVLEMVRHQFMKKGNEIETDLAENLPVVMMDIDKMEQVFLNLLINAHQAIDRRPGKIRVSTRFIQAESIVEIRIRDNGPGIEPEILRKIFDPFFSTKQTGEGTGLGLSVSYGIIKDHGGELMVETEPGQGAEFIIQLPAGKDEKSEHEG